MESWNEKKILIVGLGVQGGGVGVARYFAHHGAKVTVTDLKNEHELSISLEALKDFPNIKYSLDGHKDDDFMNADLIVKGPSVRWDNLLIERAQKHGIPVIMETSYFVSHTKAFVVGITGTRGKSTTTHCIYEALSNFYSGGVVYMAGNIPHTCSIELLDKATERDIVVLELSSWQLSGFHRAKISPQLSVFTTIYEDHLNYYENMQNYVYDKAAIFLYQKKNHTLITSPSVLEVLEKQRIHPPGKVRTYTSTDFPIEPAHLSGVHNKYNLALAFAACKLVLTQGISQEIAKFISERQKLLFRQENIGNYDNVTVVNDSTSTTPVSTITALETFTDKPIVLVMGGNSKNLSVAELVGVIERKKSQIRQIIMLQGSMSEEILPELAKISDLPVSPIYSDFKEAISFAVSTAQSLTEPVYLLFSPGATSFAQFKNEFDRGDKFNSAISDIMKK